MPAFRERRLRRFCIDAKYPPPDWPMSGRHGTYIALEANSVLAQVSVGPCARQPYTYVCPESAVPVRSLDWRQGLPPVEAKRALVSPGELHESSVVGLDLGTVLQDGIVVNSEH